MGKVLGIGNALVDILAHIDSDDILLKLSLLKGSMQLVDKNSADKVLEVVNSNGKITTASGGSAANTIHGLANLGVETAFTGKVGNDRWGEFFRTDLKAFNIKPYLYKGDGRSGRAITLISGDGERTFATHLGAAVDLNLDDISKDIFEGYSYLHVEGYLVQNPQLIEGVIKLAKSQGVKISFDLASFNVVDDNREYLLNLVNNYVDILFANEQEAFSFTKIDNDENSLLFMSKMAKVAILKKGVEGSLIRMGDEVVFASAVEASPIDTTGAGDLYAAGFIYGLINRQSLEVCGRLGALLAATVIEVTGPKMCKDTWCNLRSKCEEIIER
ncbi:adenosine kinase [Marinilabiliaceae bacterium ANBcel2]|nr:adenosine kinase [Marinilabiliaceae bacterium ANBcel2]